MKKITVLLSMAAMLASGSALAAGTPKPAAPKAAAEKGKAAAEKGKAAAEKGKMVEFTGFDKANFGARYEDVLKLYPKAEVLPEGKDMGSPTIGGPYILRLILNDQPIPGLEHPAMVELRFWKKKLWGVIVYFGDNADAKVLDMLTKRLGPSESKDPDNPLWVGEKTQTTAAVKQRWYGINDLALSKEAQTWFGLLLNGIWKAPTEEEIIELGLATPVPKATEAAQATPSPAAPAPAATPAP